MRFAVIEYNSKSGGIWRHTDAKPNYLADPDTEIDATSFGCYVSALAGEHIPLVHLVGVHIGKKIYKRLIGAWPRYSLDYLKPFDTLLVVHQMSDAHEIAVLTARLHLELPHIFIIGVPTQPFGILQPYLEANAGAKQDFIAFANNCHIFLSVVKSTQSYYQALIKTPVVYLPQIYPARYASRHFLPRERKQKIIFVAGITDRPNIAQGFLVAKKLQQEFSDYVIHITQIPGVPMDLSQLQGSNFQIQPFQKWRQHLPTLATYALAINTDYTATRGRVQADCAAVGTPSLGGNSDGAADLFPELASTPATSLEDLISQGRRLLTDENYYSQIVQSAADRLKKYDYEESAARLQLLVKQYR